MDPVQKTIESQTMDKSNAEKAREKMHRPVSNEAFISIYLALVVFIGHLGAYLFEQGFKGYYGLPSNLIELTISDTLEIASKTIGAFFFFWIIGYAGSYVWKWLHGRAYRIYKKYLAKEFDAVLVTINRRTGSRTQMFLKRLWAFIVRTVKSVLIACASFVVYVCLMVFLAYSSNSSLTVTSEFLVKHIENHVFSVYFYCFGFLIFLVFLGNQLMRMTKRFGRVHTIVSSLLMVLSFITLLASPVVGKAAAWSKGFYLVSEDKSFAVIDYYKDFMIVAPVDLSQKTMTASYQFVNCGEKKSDSIPVIPLSTGRLQLVTMDE